MKAAIVLLLALTFLLLAGSGYPKQITRPNPAIEVAGDFLLYEGKRFSGIVEQRVDALNLVRKTNYREGLPDGTQTEFFDNGQLATRTKYSQGKKNGSHEGWFRNGHRRFFYEYANDQPHGESWDWYDSGAVSSYARFENGQSLGKKMWREDGTIYMNYVFVKGRPVGLSGTKLCLQEPKSKDRKPAQE